MLCLMERGCVGNTESPMGMHDMNGIIGMTAIAGAHIDGRERVKDCLSKISAASKHLLSLINDILDFSKIDMFFQKMEYSFYYCTPCDYFISILLVCGCSFSFLGKVSFNIPFVYSASIALSLIFEISKLLQ